MMRIAGLLLSLSVILTATGTAPAAPPAARVDHVAIAVADVDRSADFYQRLFGLAELKSPLKGPRWFDLGGGVQLHLFPGRKAPVGEERRSHLALAVPDLRAFVQQLAAEKIAFSDFTGRPATVQDVRGDGVRQIFIRDPDGYWLEINDAAARGS